MAQLTMSDVIVTRPDAGRDAPPILDQINFTLAAGAAAAIAGPSGAGKTTILHVIAGLLKPSSGVITWNGVDIPALTESRRDAWRRADIGMIFQDFQLLPELTAFDNIMLPFAFDHWRRPTAARIRAGALADRVGLRDLSMRVDLMSRGEQQRVALARALMRQPKLLLADEPTASLDPVNAAHAASLLLDVARENGASLLVVSHDQALLDRIGVIHRLEVGRFRDADAHS